MLAAQGKVGEGQQRSRAHPWTSAVVTALAGGGGAALALLGSRRGWATDAVACAACLQPRAKVGEGQRCLRAHPWMSTVVTAPAGGGEQHLLCSARIRVGPLTHQLALRACGPGRRWRGDSGSCQQRSWRCSFVTYRA
jgi:hypothetical protein